MDTPMGEDWKKNVGFPINYSPETSDDDFDSKDVVFRNPRQSAAILADSGDGTEADMLGTTPPRSRIRKKEMMRRFDPPAVQRIPRRDVVDSPQEHNTPGLERQLLKKRSSMKQIRTWQRDSKQEMGIDVRCDSLPTSTNPNELPTMPTMVDTCSRFMSLSSRPKHPSPSRERSPSPSPAGGGGGGGGGGGAGGARWRRAGGDLPASRVNFHNTFSLLINMGNIEKGCKRAISREEQVWQNELKDLIWLELQARLAGRGLPQQDAFLCRQRTLVAPLIGSVLDYRFVNTNPCRRSKQNCDTNSREDLTSDQGEGREQEKIDDEEQVLGCLSFECQECSDAVGKAIRELGALLDSFYNAVALYPSSRAMTQDHPLIATPLFKNRIKAMCLWYNTALHMRLKMVSVLRMLRSIRHKARAAACKPHHNTRQSAESPRACQVRFDVGANPSDSSSSDCSAHSDAARDRPDDADSGNETASTGQSVNTPEIVFPEQEGWQDAPPDAVDAAALQELTQFRLLNKCDVSLYREYHREILKTQGVRRCMTFIYKMRTNLLDKVYLTLEKSDFAESEDYAQEESTDVFDDQKDDSEKQKMTHDEDEIKNYELRRYGCRSAECLRMRLPSYRAPFLLLGCICMEAVHDYLSFRLEATPDNPSCLTVKQLIHELREGLDISSEMRADFVRYARAALAAASPAAASPASPAAASPAPAAAAPHLRQLLHTYDSTVHTLLQQYLSYLTTMSETESLPRACLQAEWAFTARLARRIRCAAALAPAAFSNITCNQLNRLLKQFDEEFRKLVDEQSVKGDPDKEAVYAVCRGVQSMFAWSREPALQTAQWARALAARLARAPPPAYVRQRAQMLDCIMAIRDFILKHIMLVLDRSQPGADEPPREPADPIALRVRELLLQIYKLGFELHKELYKFVHGTRPADRPGARRPTSLQPIRAPLVERRKRPETVLVHESFNPMIHKELHRFVHETPDARSPPGRPAASPPDRPAAGPPPPRSKFVRTDSILEDYESNLFEDRLFDTAHGDGQSLEQLLDERAGGSQARCREEARWAGRVARAVVQFARCWMKFVVERCDRGRGLRPRWASQGLEFLMLACDPCNTKHLSEEEFEELKQRMDGCISHVVGSRPAPRAPDPAPHSPRPRPRLPSPFPSNSTGREPPPPSPPSPPGELGEPLEPDPLLSYPEADSIVHRRRVLAALARVETAREQRLRAAGSVGRVLRAAVASYEPKLRQLTFKWQRGLKIGAGSFGKVYTVVNTESGQLLAMKELAVGAGDRRALQRAANELRVLEGVAHPHLVRYYGCELHREEMLLFMELCVEGSLEALVATAGALGEGPTRRYTKQLLSAVAELHARAIAHRDIKSGNIFLTNEGHCLKLGDFGCAVKIRANTTAPGELQGFVGTQAYMAPEVFMQPAGHGRAADIWSLGCVVTEMASGKRPFSEYDSNHQIMFLVGMGGRPAEPAALSAEGRAFCRACLTHDPALRPTADALSTHHFLMLKSDDDCKCETAYLIT